VSKNKKCYNFIIQKSNYFFRNTFCEKLGQYFDRMSILSKLYKLGAFTTVYQKHCL